MRTPYWWKPSDRVVVCEDVNMYGNFGWGTAKIVVASEAENRDITFLKVERQSNRAELILWLDKESRQKLIEKLIEEHERPKTPG